MKLEKWALIAEVVSAAAILVTLVLLVLEVRTNTDVSRIAAYQSVTRDFDNWRSMVLNDPELLEMFAQLVVSGQYPDPSDDPVARARLVLLTDNQFSGNEHAFLAWRGGIKWHHDCYVSMKVANRWITDSADIVAESRC